MYGNELIAKGGLASGLDFYSAYPMTPASSIIDEVIVDKNLTFFQEKMKSRSVWQQAGAKFAGKRAACGTS